jgi:tetratricopeptide (TPR) repeat protein
MLRIYIAAPSLPRRVAVATWSGDKKRSAVGFRLARPGWPGYIAVAFLAFSVLHKSTSAQSVSDRVRLTRGSESGEVAESTPYEVTLNNGPAGGQQIAVNQIKAILFDGEPSELAQARVNAANGAFENASQLLEKINISSVKRDLIRQDIEFYKAWCAGKLALAGQGAIADAGRQLNNFVRSNPNSFHTLEVREAMGDLLMAGGGYANAEKQYAELAKAPWPDYKMRAAVAIGRSLQAQKKHAEAIKQFDAALAIPDQSPDAQAQRLAATLGKAISTAETGGVDQAVGVIEKVIHDADPEQKELHARACLALGKCYESAGRTKDALIWYLHVDVLYNTVPEAHAEALSHLVPLWTSLGQNERAREARQILNERYGQSRWAKATQ